MHHPIWVLIARLVNGRGAFYQRQTLNQRFWDLRTFVVSGGRTHSPQQKCPKYNELAQALRLNQCEER